MATGPSPTSPTAPVSAAAAGPGTPPSSTMTRTGSWTCSSPACSAGVSCITTAATARSPTSPRRHSAGRRMGQSAAKRSTTTATDGSISTWWTCTRTCGWGSIHVTSLSEWPQDRKSTRLNSSHGYISYAVFCLKKKKNNILSSNTQRTYVIDQQAETTDKTKHGNKITVNAYQGLASTMHVRDVSTSSTTHT